MKYIIFLWFISLLILPDNLFSKLNKIPNINKGGCGYVAYYLNGPIERIGDHYMVRKNGILMDSRGKWGILMLKRRTAIESFHI